MGGKTKTPAGEKCERTLPFKLGDEEKARKGEIAAGLNKKLEEAVEAKNVDMKKHGAKIKDLTSKVSAQLKMINEGVERRVVQCTAVKNYEGDVIEYWFEGQIMETVKMKDSDRQLNLNEKVSKEKTEKAIAKGKEKWQRMAPKKPMPNGEDKDEQIAQVHKLETSRKGASSAVDPK